MLPPPPKRLVISDGGPPCAPASPENSKTAALIAKLCNTMTLPLDVTYFMCEYILVFLAVIAEEGLKLFLSLGIFGINLILMVKFTEHYCYINAQDVSSNAKG